VAAGLDAGAGIPTLRGQTSSSAGVRETSTGSAVRERLEGPSWRVRLPLDSGLGPPRQLERSVCANGRHSDRPEARSWTDQPFSVTISKTTSLESRHARACRCRYRSRRRTPAR
jgi:hypothetical protein